MGKLYIYKRYGQVPNDILNNPNLSLKAKGLFAFLQSKPDGWMFSIERISGQTRDGKDAIRSAIKELEKNGFLIRKIIRNEKGEWSGYDYILSENPLSENPTTDNPMSENPDAYSKKDIVRKKKNKSVYTSPNGEVSSTSSEEEPSQPSPASRSPSVPFKKIQVLWNTTIEKNKSVLPRLVTINPNTPRATHVKARWKEFPDLAIWEKVFQKASKSSFLNGNNKRGFQGKFDWIVKSNSNFSKVLEGNYDDEDTSLASQSSNTTSTKTSNTDTSAKIEFKTEQEKEEFCKKARERAKRLKQILKSKDKKIESSAALLEKRKRELLKQKEKLLSRT